MKRPYKTLSRSEINMQGVPSDKKIAAKPQLKNIRMKYNELRLGNLISLAYDPEKYGVVIAMDITGSVHLGNKEMTDDIRDVIGLEITEALLEKLGYETTIYTHDHEILLSFTGKQVTVTIDVCLPDRRQATTYHLRFFHELQNAVYINTGQELLDPYELIYQ